MRRPSVQIIGRGSWLPIGVYAYVSSRILGGFSCLKIAQYNFKFMTDCLNTRDAIARMSSHTIIRATQ
jgi:hypothetical protein